jgi:broad specificity phosphatase PhoE
MPFYPAEDQFREQMRAFFDRPHERVLGNESADEAHARFANAVAQLPTSGDPGATVVVSHGAVLTLLVTRANDLEPFPFWSDLAFASFVVLSTPSLTLRHVDNRS